MTMKYISYTRFSSDNQRSSSNDDQHFGNLRKFEDFGIPENQVTWIKDEGISGDHENRPGYQQVMRAIEASEVKILVVDDQSRWSREDIIGDFLKKCAFYGARFIAVTDNIDTELEGTELSAQVKGWQNQQFLRDHAKKVRRGLKGRARDPNGSTGNHPFGYRSEWENPDEGARYDGNCPKPMKKVVIDEPHAEIVCKIYNLFVEQKKSLNEIARYLNENKIPLPPRSNAKIGWSAGLVRRVLQNKKYVGIWVYGANRTVKYKGQRRNIKVDDKDVVTTHRPFLSIISKELFEGAAKRFKEFKEVLGPNTGKSRHSKLGKYVRLYPFNLLSGMLSCSECGTPLHRGAGNGGHYYRCPNHARNGGCGSKTSVNMVKAEEVIISFMHDKLNNIDDWFDLVYEQVLRNIAEHDARIPSDKENLLRRKAGLEKEIETLSANLKLRVSQTLADGLSASEESLKELNKSLEAMERKQGSKRRLPTKAEAAAELSDMVSIMSEDPTRGSLLLRKIIGERQIKATDVIFPGKERGYAKLSFRFDPMHLLAVVYDDADIIPSDEQSSLIEDVVLFTGNPTEMEKWLPKVHEWRLDGVTWKEIHERTGMSSSCLGNYLKRYRKALVESGAANNIDSTIVNNEDGYSTIVNNE